MHNLIRKIVLILVFVILLCSCSEDKVKVDYINKVYETESEIIHLEIPSFHGLGTKELSDEISYDYEGFSQELLNSFIEASNNSKDNRTGKSKLEMKNEVKYNKNGIFSLVGEIYKYTQGAYGASDRRILNVDINNSKVLLLKDLFCDEKYIDMLNSKLEKLSCDAIYSDLWEKPMITDKQNECFYFDNKGLVIFYPPYELSYYARGFVEFTIPYKELYGYLKPEYSTLYR